MDFGLLGTSFDSMGAIPYETPAVVVGGSRSLDFSDANNSMYLSFV